MKKERIFNILSLVCNVLMVAFVVYCVAVYSDTIEGKDFGEVDYIFFTTDSNIFCALVSLIIIPFNVIALKKKIPLVLPGWLTVLKFMGTVATALTLFTVFIMLGPMFGYGMMLARSCLFLHLLCPLLAMISFVFFENRSRLTYKATFVGIVPNLIYGLIYALNVLIFEGVDIYGFTKVGAWYIMAAASVIGSYIISFGIWFVRKKVGRH